MVLLFFFFLHWGSFFGFEEERHGNFAPRDVTIYFIDVFDCFEGCLELCKDLK